MYKIITKALSCRIKRVLPVVIDDSQSSFLKDRGLLDSVLVANEVVEELRRYRRRDLCLKVDYEKAYDSVRWDFLFDMLHRLGFHSKWIMWIRGCLESALVSVLVNRSSTTEFHPSRGLRQGDPLAPFLFLIVAEGLAGLVREAIKANLLKGVKVGKKEVEAFVLQFIDDTLFMCEDTYNKVMYIKAILRFYELAFGLKINFYKLKPTGINVESNAQCYHISAMASPWRISVAEFQTTATTRRWRIGFRMAAHGGRYWHGGAVTDIGDIQNIGRQRSLKE